MGGPDIFILLKNIFTHKSFNFILLKKTTDIFLSMLLDKILVRLSCFSAWTSPSALALEKRVEYLFVLFLERIFDIFFGPRRKKSWISIALLLYGTLDVSSFHFKGFLHSDGRQPRPYQGMKLLCRSTFINVKSVWKKRRGHEKKVWGTRLRLRVRDEIL